MARTTRPLDNTNTTSTERQIGPFTVTKTLRDAVLVLDRTNFTNPAVTFSLRAEYRTAPNAAWQLWGGFTTTGGQTSDPTEFQASYVPPRGSEARVLVKTSGMTVKQALSLVEVD